MMRARQSEILIRVLAIHHDEVGICALLTTVQGVCQREGA